MSPELIGTILTGIGILLGVWRLVEGRNILLADRKSP